MHEEEPGGVQPPPLSEVRPQETLQRHAGVVELVQALDATVLRMGEEVDDVSLALPALQEHVIVLAFPDVPMTSSMSRAVQPVDVELSLRLPVLNNVWFEDWTFQEYPVQVIPPDPAREHPQRSHPELVHALQDSLASGTAWDVQSGRFMEQVVGVPVHGQAPSVSEEDVEQVADVPGFGHAPRASSPVLSRQLLRCTLRRSNKGSFSHFSPKQKRCEDWAAVDCQSSGSPARPRRGLMATWIPGSGLLAALATVLRAKSTMSIVMYTVPVMLPGLLTDTPWGPKAFREHMALSLFGWRHTTVLSLTLTTMWLRCARFALPIIVKRLGAYLGIAGWITCP